MVSEAYPWLGEDATIKEAIAPLARMRGTVPVVSENRRLVGVLTAGDLTRLMEREADFLLVSVSDVMTRDPKTATLDELGSAAASRMESHGVMALPVVRDDGSLVGVVHLHDLMRAGAV
jgi:arabinose-5-phosphate isomerase